MAVYYGLVAGAHAWLTSVREEKGQTFAEYAVIIGITVVAVVVAVGGLRDAVIGVLDATANAL